MSDPRSAFGPCFCDRAYCCPAKPASHQCADYWMLEQKRTPPPETPAQIAHPPAAPSAWLFRSEKVERLFRDREEAERHVALYAGDGIAATITPLYAHPPVADHRLREALQLGLEAAEELLNETIDRYTSPNGDIRDFRGRITAARATVETIRAALAHPPAADNRLREALANLYHSLPDVLPAAGVERLRATGKWAAGDSYAKRGHTGTVEYRADDMEAVYAAMDDARAALATEQGDR